jgi:hypothetical protein
LTSSEDYNCIIYITSQSNDVAVYEVIKIHEYPCGIREISPEGLNISVRDEACRVPDRNIQSRGWDFPNPTWIDSWRIIFLTFYSEFIKNYQNLHLNSSAKTKQIDIKSIPQNGLHFMCDIKKRLFSRELYQLKFKENNSQHIYFTLQRKSLKIYDVTIKWRRGMWDRKISHGSLTWAKLILHRWKCEKRKSHIAFSHGQNLSYTGGNVRNRGSWTSVYGIWNELLDLIFPEPWLWKYSNTVTNFICRMHECKILFITHISLIWSNAYFNIGLNILFGEFIDV